MPSAIELVEFCAADEIATAVAIEAVCMKIASGESDLSPDEAVVLSKLDNEQRRKEIGRCQRMRMLTPTAGTAAQRKKSRADLDAAIKHRDENELRLDKAIDALLDEKRVNNQAVAAKQKVVDDQTNAVIGLRHCAPPRIKAEHNRQRLRLGQKYLEIESLKSELSCTDGVLVIDPDETRDGLPAALLHADTGCPEAVIRAPDGHGDIVRTLNRDTWAKYIQRLREERPVKASRLAELEAAYAAEMAENDLLLDVYVK
jgi:hypothetical protein